MGSQLDLDDVAATSDLAMQELLDLRAEIARLRAEVEVANGEAGRYFDSWKRMTLKARAIHIESLRYRKSMIEILDAAIDAARGQK